MSDVRLNVQARDAWWATCSLCDYESAPTLSRDEAEQARVAHHREHFPVREAADR